MTMRLGRYELGEEIGRGAMAIVHRAYDPRLERHIAIKMLRPEFAREERHRRYFLSEAHAAGRLTHAGIVTVHDVGDDDGHPFMAMELLSGTTLQRTLDRDGWLPAAEVVDIGLQLAEALDYAHEHGVVHRDIKPDNVVRMDDGLGIKLADFGIARVRQAAATESERDVVGTPNFMAPEQVRGEAVDGRADLYALGVLMYVALGGRTPFRRETIRETLTAILEEPAPVLQPRDPETPPALIDMISTLMAKRPADRYQTGAELAQDLRQVARDLEDRSAGGWRIPLRVRWPVAMGAVVAATMLVGALAVHHHQREAMRDIAFDYGATLVQTIGAESAEDLLLEDRVAVQAMVDGMLRNRHMAYLGITDRHGEIIASTLPAEIGGVGGRGPFAEPLRERADGLRIFRQTAGDSDAFLFEGPIEYGGRRIGEIALAMPAAPLNAALRTTLAAMVGLFAAVVLTALTASYIMARRLAVPLRLLGNALDQITRGGLAYRIRLSRRDEFGSVFMAYNRMAAHLQGKLSGLTRSHTAGSPSRRPAGAHDETRDMTQPVDPSPHR